MELQMPLCSQHTHNLSHARFDFVVLQTHLNYSLSKLPSVVVEILIYFYLRIFSEQRFIMDTTPRKRKSYKSFERIKEGRVKKKVTELTRTTPKVRKYLESPERAEETKVEEKAGKSTTILANIAIQSSGICRGLSLRSEYSEIIAVHQKVFRDCCRLWKIDLQDGEKGKIEIKKQYEVKVDGK